ncbi:hypothetical protein JG688_00018461 [Phytophthora aleatoria]|uniref:BED-type domain-containing protein n=1 Tax=Phytophthora aleatoria TaxID=2496075 RepID=A0A8J5I8P3_9STRA|nr:hypothetical protein JG688_00018461 [Phytophthora aleatoria]
MSIASFFSAPAPQLKSKTVVEMMFREPNVDGRACNACNACNSFVKQLKVGYTNLLSHLMSKHPGYENVVRKCLLENRRVSMKMFIDCHALSTYQWMNLVMHKNFTFAYVDDERVRAAIEV